ncbi:hypothetical protein [Sinomonas albida]|uniref:hypothetical protein n=1 Tax=Sinomonas albida TaxID=369942 RepID=UPI0010A8D60E|nr:hypothetical protein [Sinomonas albida]
MLFITAVVSALAAGRRPAVVLAAPAVLLAVVAAVAALLARDLQALHLVDARAAHPTFGADARRVADFVARAVAAVAGETALAALVAGLGAAVLLGTPGAAAGVLATTALVGVAVVAVAVLVRLRSRRDFRPRAARVQQNWRLLG